MLDVIHLYNPAHNPLNKVVLCSFMIYVDTSVLQFIAINSTDGVLAESVGHFDDGVSHAIYVPQGIPFGNLQHTFIFVSMIMQLAISYNY